MVTLNSRLGIRLSQLDGNRPVLDERDVSAYLVTHNERLRLPFVLDYHRKLGVRHFFCVDDKSDDGTREYLIEESLQGDVSVFESDSTYKEARGGLDWVEALMDEYADGKWILKLDADEIFVYSGCGDIGIQKVVDFLVTNKYEGMLSYLLDLYPAGAISDAKCAEGEPFWNVAKYFDEEIRIFKRMPLVTRTSPQVMITGGVRTRLFYPDMHPVTKLKLTMARLGRLMSRQMHWAGSFIRSDVPPILEKVPLRVWHRGVSKYLSAHQTNRIAVSPLYSALLHFKYLSDFHKKVEDAVRRKQYFNEASEYFKYQAMILKDPLWKMMTTTSIKYTGVNQLVDRGLIQRGGWSR